MFASVAQNDVYFIKAIMRLSSPTHKCVVFVLLFNNYASALPFPETLKSTGQTTDLSLAPHYDVLGKRIDYASPGAKLV